MSDWMLYHVWRIRGYEVKHCERVEPECLVVTITAKPKSLCCPCCGSKDVIRKGVNLRLLRGTPVGRTQVLFAAHVPRVRCDRCDLTRQVRIPFAEEKRRHTRQFERYALELAQLTTTALARTSLSDLVKRSIVTTPVTLFCSLTRISRAMRLERIVSFGFAACDFRCTSAVLNLATTSQPAMQLPQ